MTLPAGPDSSLLLRGVGLLSLQERFDLGLLELRQLPLVVRLGFGRVVVSEKEAPILLANLVYEVHER